MGVKKETIVKDYISGLSGVEVAQKYGITLYKVYSVLSEDKNSLLIELMRVNDNLNVNLDYRKLSSRDILNFKLKVIELLLKYFSDSLSSAEDKLISVVITEAKDYFKGKNEDK